MFHAIFLAYMPTGEALKPERDPPGVLTYRTNREEGSALGGPSSSTKLSIPVAMTTHTTTNTQTVNELSSCCNGCCSSIHDYLSLVVDSRRVLSVAQCDISCQWYRDVDYDATRAAAALPHWLLPGLDCLTAGLPLQLMPCCLLLKLCKLLIQWLVAPPGATGPGNVGSTVARASEQGCM